MWQWKSNHVSAHPTPNGYFVPSFATYLPPPLCSSIAKFLLFHCHTSALPLPNGCSSIATFLLFHCQLATFYPSIATFLPHLSGIPMPLFGSSIANWLVFALPLKGEGAITNQLRLNPSFWEPSRWGSRGSHVRGGGVIGLKTNVFAASQKERLRSWKWKTPNYLGNLNRTRPNLYYHFQIQPYAHMLKVPF